MSQRFYVILFCLASGLVSVAQNDVVKDAEHILAKAKPDYAEALKTIKPALENEETAKNPQAWYIAGKAALGVWDKLWTELQVGTDVNSDKKKNGARTLTDAYRYFATALPLDSLPDAKGKVKPKYSKEIKKTLARYYRPFRNAGIFLYDAGDLQGAFDAWEIYVNLPARLKLGQKDLKPDNNTDIGQILYYQALAAISSGDNAHAVDKFTSARRSGFSTKDLYLYAMEASRRMENDSLMIEFARYGNELYGREDVSFSLVLINDCLTNRDYEHARRLASEALAVTSDDKIKSQLYDVLGVTAEQEGNVEEAFVQFQKSVVYDPDNAKCFFDLGRLIYNESLKIIESGDKEAEESKAIPGLKKAAEYFEKAYSLDPSMSQIPSTLYSLYYRLGIGYETNADYWFRKQQERQ